MPKLLLTPSQITVTGFCAQKKSRTTRRRQRLQVENRGHVTRIAAAVDASLATVKLAIAVGRT